jgi:hypothetical protein
VEELLEGGDIEDLVVGGLRSIDDELQARHVSNYKRSVQGFRAFTHLLSDLLGLAGTDLLNRKDSISLLFHLSSPRLCWDASPLLKSHLISAQPWAFRPLAGEDGLRVRRASAFTNT